MQSLLHTVRLNVPEGALRNVSDISRMVNHDSSPSPRLPAHCLQCKCSPFVSVDQMSQRLLCWSASLLIRSEQREQSLDQSYQLFPFIYTDSGCTLVWKIHQSIRLSSQAPGISLLSNTLNVAQPIPANWFYSVHVLSVLYQKIDTICTTFK